MLEPPIHETREPRERADCPPLLPLGKLEIRTLFPRQFCIVTSHSPCACPQTYTGFYARWTGRALTIDLVG